MPRIRSVKPEFFTDEDIATLSPLCRLFYIGLWDHADSKGRLEDRPLRLKTVILPYDDCDVEEFLDALSKPKKYSSTHDSFIKRYVGPDGRNYIQILAFNKHQYITKKERRQEKSTMPAPCSDDESMVTACTERKGKERKGKERKGESPKPPQGVDFKSICSDIMHAWNIEASTKGWRRAMSWNQKRKRDLKARLKENKNFLEHFCKAVAWADLPWMRGEGRTRDGEVYPRASLDWALRPGKIQSILEDMESPKKNINIDKEVKL
jgi:hypothetical protein